MKLYTEEQVKKAIDIAEYRGYEWEQIIAKLTPIELPSDEEITQNLIIQELYSYATYEGAKWMKEQILNQNK